MVEAIVCGELWDLFEPLSLVAPNACIKPTVVTKAVVVLNAYFECREDSEYIESALIRCRVKQ